MLDGEARPRRRSIRLHVLIEAPAPYSLTMKAAARMGDCELIHCAGPAADHRCPVVDGLACPDVADCDVVVTSLGLDADQSRRVLQGLHAVHPATPSVVLAWQADLTRHAELLANSRVVTFPWTVRKLRSAVLDAAHGGSGPVESRER